MATGDFCLANAQWAPRRPLAVHPESCLDLQKNAHNSAIFGQISRTFVCTNILRCWQHIFGKKLKIGQKLQNLRRYI